MSKNTSGSAKLQILLNRVLEKDFKAVMEVEAFASQSTVEELFDAYKQVDLRVKKSSKELERYYYNNYYSFIESAREQIDTTKLLEQVNNKLAHQYIPLIEEINSSFEGIREQLADEMLRYEQLKKYSIAKKQTGWVTDLFVNLEKSFHRIKGLSPQHPKETALKDINYKIYGYIIRCAYHIKNYYLLTVFQQKAINPELHLILEKCHNVIIRTVSIFESMLSTHSTYCGNWGLEYPILILIHSFCNILQIPCSITSKIESNLANIFVFYGTVFKSLSSTDVKVTMQLTTNDMFIKMRNLVLKDVCLFVSTLDSLSLNLDPLTSDAMNMKIIYNHFFQIRQLTLECDPVLTIFTQLHSPLLYNPINGISTLVSNLYTSLITLSLKKDFLGENFNSNKLIHLLRNIKVECHEAAFYPFDFLFSIDKSTALMKIDENCVLLQLLSNSDLCPTKFPLDSEFFTKLGNSLMTIVVQNAIKCSFLEVNAKLAFALDDCLKFITIQFSSKQLATGLLEVERVLDKTLNDTVRKQLKKIRKHFNEQALWFDWPVDPNLFQDAVHHALHSFWQSFSDSELVDPNAQLILSRVCFDSDIHLMDACFLKFLNLIISDIPDQDDDEEPNQDTLQLYNTLDIGVKALREHVRLEAKQKLGNYILHHCLHLGDIMMKYFNDLTVNTGAIKISSTLIDCIAYIKDIESFVSVIFDEQAQTDLYAKKPQQQRKGHNKKYSLDDRFSDRESMSSSTGLSPTKTDSKSVPTSNSQIVTPKMYSTHVHKLFRKHVDYYPQLPSTCITNGLQVRVDFTKEAVIEHLLLVVIKHLTEGLKNRVSLFYMQILTSQQYEQCHVDIEYLKMIIRLSATKLESSILDDKFLMILLDEARTYAFQQCQSPRSPDTKYMQQLLEEERIKLGKTK